MSRLRFGLWHLLGLLVLLGCKDAEVEKKKAPRPVKYAEVAYLGGEKIRTFSGTAQTDKIVQLSFRGSGIITEFNLRLGQQVKKGDLLARLDNVQSRLAYEQAVTQLNTATSQMNTAKLSYNRVRSLYEQGSMSLSDFEAAKNSYRAAQDSYESAKRGVAIQNDQIQYGYLYAPEDGVIGAVEAENDENVSPGQVIGTLNAGTDMEITLGIPESVINDISQGMKVSISFSSLLDQQFDGTVSEVSPALDAGTATYPVRVIVDQPTDAIKSGMSANVTFDFGDRAASEKVIIVPAVSVGEDSNGNFVFVIEEAGEDATISKKPIQIGPLTEDGFVVESGLSVGQKVATAGLQTLLNGQQVQLQN